MSYAHADRAWARWLHGRLEAYPLDRTVRSRPGRFGPVPVNLKPIFFDRANFTGGSSLTEATIAALDGSTALIVLCSPVAAGRPAVQEEVRLFRARHPDRPVIPVIINGTHPDYFPPALRFALLADGTVGTDPIAILGPDLRETGDGRELGLAKAVAGLLGFDNADDIFRGSERAWRQRYRARTAFAAVVLLLAAGTGFSTWQYRHAQGQLTDIAALLDKLSPIGSAEAAEPDAREELTKRITAIAQGAGTDPRYARALELLKLGKDQEAAPLLLASAKDTEARLKAAEFDPDNTVVLYWAALLQLDAGEQHFNY